MKFLKMLLFCFICGIFGMVMRIIGFHHGFIASAGFGLIEGGLIAFTILNFDTCKDFFFHKRKDDALKKILTTFRHCGEFICVNFKGDKND